MVIFARKNPHFMGFNEIEWVLMGFNWLYGLFHFFYGILWINRQNCCNTNLVLLRLGLFEIAQNLHNQ
jgi:hypothetical protein